MSGLPAEVLLLIGGGVVTVTLAAIVITLLVRASREHDRVVRGTRDRGAAGRGAPKAPGRSEAP